MASKPSHFPLDISKLKFVLQVLRHYKFPEARWLDFGLNLDIPYHTLKAIESANKGDPSNCLMECLAKWLTEGSDHTLVWQTLANALRGMNALAVASNIHKTMADPVSEILQYYIGRLAQVVLTEESVDLLHTEGLISKDTLTEVKSCGCSLVGDPMLLILSAVAEDHSKLCTLTSILMKSKEAVSLASDIIMEYGKSFPSAVTVMPSCQQASTSASSNTGSGELQDSSSETQVTTDTDATDATAQGVVEVIVHPGYKAEFDRMSDMLGTLIDDLVPLIKVAVPSDDELIKLKTYIRRCRPYLENQLEKAETFDAVMRVVEDECSITNVALLETIVNKYSIQDAGDMILAYQTHLDEFCENKLTMFCDRQLKRLSSSLLTCETIKFVLKWNPSEHSLSSIRALLWKTFKDNQVEVVVIKEGNSIIVTCYAPHYLMESLLVTARDNVDMLKEMGLISLTIGYYTVYDEHAIDEEVKSLMKKLEMVESERDDLLKGNAKLKGISYEGREVVESNKSSIQSSGFKRSISDDVGADAAPHTWRHFKRAPKEVIIIGSFENHEQWKLLGTIVSPKLIPAGVEGSYEKWIAEEVDSIAEIYKKDRANYELKDIPEKGKSRQFYLNKIKSLFDDCKKDEALIYYTGHGEKETGNWCFEDGVISFNDIFELYMMHFRGKSLQIVSDCSYSGKWIHDCSKKLDEYGILSCGHKTRERRMLFKIFTSCLPHEEATLLTYSRKGIRYSEEDKGVLIRYDEEIKMEPAQKGQHPMHVDFRHIHCYKLPGDQCELDSTCTWEDRLGKNRERTVFLVDNKHEKFPSWYYLLIFEVTFDEFKGKQDKENIGVEEATKYGKVLYSGPGQNPPSDVKKKLNLRFDMNTYASYKFTDC